jgi:hypothetical protein
MRLRSWCIRSLVYPPYAEPKLGVDDDLGEALALAWDQVDLDGATVAVSYTLIRVKGQGLVRKTTKTAAGIRELPLPPSTVAMLRRRRRTIGLTPCSRTATAAGAILPTPNGICATPEVPTSLPG